MTLDQENARLEYSKLINAAWSDFEETAPARTFDGENLNPLHLDSRLSPFIATFGLALDVKTFMLHQGVRRHAASEVWPKIERAEVHLKRKQFDFFEKELRELEYEGPLTTARQRILGLVEAIENYGLPFGPVDPARQLGINSRIVLAHETSRQAVSDVVTYFRSKGRHDSLTSELHRIRQQWVKLLDLLLPIYNIFYWDEAKRSLDSFTIGQKRFDELKPFYVDCFETFCRISSIAAALEGVIATSSATVPTRKGMSIEAFELMSNGAKPNVLGNLEIARAFVPFIDSHLRNGMGHNAAAYDVTNDIVLYVNENEKAVTRYQIPYVRFCEKVVRLYAQVELVARYAHWLRIHAA